MTKDEIIKALTDRLNAVHLAIDSATDTMSELKLDDLDVYNELISELAPTETLLIKLNEALDSGLETDISVGRVEIKESDFEKENKLLIQYFRELRSQLLDGRFKEDSVLIKAIDYALDGKKELRVYLVDGYFWRNRINDWDNLSNEEFVSMAEAEGKVYSIQGFVKAFNEEEINTFVDFIRII